MNIAEIIAALNSGQDPSTAVMGAFPGGPQAGPPSIPQFLQSSYLFGQKPQQAEPPSEPPPQQAQAQTPIGVQTPVTNPQAPGQSPTITQSPPDLANMYMELMKKNQNAQALDSGLTMIAAGLARTQPTRTALIGAASREGLAGAKGMTSADFINLQKAQQSAQDLAVRRAAIPSLMKQFGISPAAAQYMEATGKMDELLQKFMTEDLVHIKDDATGRTSFYSKRTGEKVIDIGGGLTPTEDERAVAAINAERQAAGQPALTREEFAKTVKREEPAGDDKARLAQINTERQAKGQAPMTMETYLSTLKHKAPAEVFTDEHGNVRPKPPAGFDYTRTPEGMIAVDENNQPSLVPISPKAKVDIKHTELQTEEQQRKLDEARKKENKERVGSAFAASNAGAAVDSAMGHADRILAAGLGSRWASQYSPGGLPIDSLKSDLSTINANTAIQTLQAMRAASPTGGAVGNVSDFEQKLLASTIGNLDYTQEPGQLKRNLIRVKAALHVMAEQTYDEANVGKFNKELQDKIREFTEEHERRSQPSTPTVRKPKVERLPRE